MISLLKFFRFLGPTLLFFGTFVVLPPLVLSYFNDVLDNQMLNIYLVCISYSVIIFFTLRQRKFTYSPKDGFVITFLTWVIISLLASMPFMNSNIAFFDALFEAVSGLTTTGSTVIKDLSQLSDHVLLYRQLLQWAGMAEAIEIVVDSSYEKLKGKCISDLRLDENINIPALKRGEDVIMAHGDTEIYDEDHLIVFYKNKDVIDNFYNAFR